VELVLMTPFLAFLALMAFNATRMLIIKQHVVVEARTTAWRGALFGGPWGRSRCPTNVAAALGGQRIFTTCDTDGSEAAQLLGRVERSGERARDLIRAMRSEAGAAAVPERVEINAFSVFVADRALGWPVLIENRHSVDAQAAWMREDLPIGYDRYLRRRIDSDYIFPDFFPRAR
jgi:hypothetical protein